MLTHIEIRDANAHATHNVATALAECGVSDYFLSSYYDEVHIDASIPKRNISALLIETLSYYGLHVHSVTH